MRIAIISDIHGNYVALRTVLDHMGSVDALWCLGDLVGYGPQPNECIAAIADRPHLCIPGNHDWGMLDRLDKDDFNRDARAILEWTAKVITPEHRDYLKELPVLVTALDSSFTLIHASPRDPMWEYLLDLFDAAECFPLFNTRYCLVGHTHVPLIFREMSGVVKALVPEPGDTMSLSVQPYRPGEDPETTTNRLIINPGSIGQPRDGDPRAAYMVLDMPDDAPADAPSALTATLSFVRLEYPVIETQSLMQSLGFPPRLIARIELGI